MIVFFLLSFVFYLVIISPHPRIHTTHQNIILPLLFGLVFLFTFDKQLKHYLFTKRKVL